MPTTPTVPSSANRGSSPGLVVARKVAAYLSALAMLPYFLVKIFWVRDGLDGGGLHEGVWKTLDWAAINAMTVAMSGAAIALALALGHRWGLRLPAWLLLFPGWVAMGFLCTLLPLIPVFALLPTAGGDPAASSLPVPGWELALISVSFAGFGLGLAVTVPLYVRERWPALLSRREVGEDAAAGQGAGSFGRTPGSGKADALRVLRLSLGRPATCVCALLAGAQAYWALGGTLGLDPQALAGRDLRWHLLTGANACWALVATWGAATVGGRRSGPPGAVTLLLVWLASGGLFAWGSWRATFVFAAPSAYSAPEYPAVQALQNHLGALAGLVILVLLLLRVVGPVHAPGNGPGSPGNHPNAA